MAGIVNSSGNKEKRLRGRVSGYPSILAQEYCTGVMCLDCLSSMIWCAASSPKDVSSNDGSVSSLYRLMLIGWDEYQTNIAADRAIRR